MHGSTVQLSEPTRRCYVNHMRDAGQSQKLGRFAMSRAAAVGQALQNALLQIEISKAVVVAGVFGMLAAIAAGTAGADVPSQDSTSALERSPHPAGIPQQQVVGAGAGPGAKLVIGDVVNIVFAGRSSAGAGAPAETTGATSTYMIQQDGNVYLPLLGGVQLADLLINEASEHVRSKHKQATQEDARVSIVIVRREPVYILGNVAKPGTYEFVPGMTLLHALALAGGLPPGASVNSEFFEVVRETQRLNEAVAARKRLLARIAVLSAEREKVDPKPSEKLTMLAGSAGATDLMAKVANLNRLTIESRRSRLASLDATIESCNRELEMHEQRIAFIKANAESKSKRAELFEQLQERGMAKGMPYVQAKSELSDVMERLQEALVAKVQIEGRRSQAQHERARIVAEARADVERDIASTEELLADAERMADSSIKILQISSVAVPGSPSVPDQQPYVIARRTLEGLVEILASETFELDPGDLVWVRSTSAGRSGFDSSPPPSPEADAVR